MRTFIPVALAVGMLLPAARADEPGPEAWAKHRGIRVLYAGWPGGSREKAFKAFLEQWFDRVGILDLKKLSVETAADYNIVIADWGSHHGKDGYWRGAESLFSAKITLGPEFKTPIIAMGYVGGIIRLEYKLDWL